MVLVQKAKGCYRVPEIPLGVSMDRDSALPPGSFPGLLARQEKATVFPTEERKENNKGSFLLNVVGETSEAKQTPELHEEKGGFM